MQIDLLTLKQISFLIITPITDLKLVYFVDNSQQHS